MMSGGGGRSSGGGGDVLGSILGGLMSGGDEAEKRPGEASGGRQPSVQDIFGDMLDDGSGGSAADDLLESVFRHSRR